MNETLVAKQSMFYRHRALTAGQTFEATPIDAQYFVRRGQAALLPRVPVSDVIKAEPVAPVAEPVVAEVVTLSPEPEVKEEPATVEVATEVAGEVTPEVEAAEAAEITDAVRARRPYTRRRTTAE